MAITCTPAEADERNGRAVDKTKKIKVFLNEYIHPQAFEKLRKYADVTERIEDIPEVDAIILRTFEVPGELMRKAVNLKVIGKHGVGYNTIDIETARELGIQVIYTPTANTNSVAELIVALLLDILRNVTVADRSVREGKVQRIAPPELSGRELAGKTVGLIGMGNIALRFAEIVKNGFAVRLIGYDPFVTDKAAKESGIEKVETVEELLERADIVNVSVPLTKDTENLIGGERFNYFKPGAVLVNAARGGIVNEDDLYHALKEGKLSAAACDVFAEEPIKKSHPLLELDNFVATPHIGADTEDALYRMGMQVVDNVIHVVEGKEAEYRVV